MTTHIRDIDAGTIANGFASTLLAPDFVIVGAPKCGTTALYSYLATHPRIAMSSRKEPYFWCPDIPIPSPVNDPDRYAALWVDATPGVLRGEATPAYLRSMVATAAILRANPLAKFVVLLRNPADMAVSFHAQMLVARQEDVTDFESAWSLQRRRQCGERVPAACFFPRNLQYAWVCALGDQLDRVAAIIPPNQLHVATLDDLAADPRATYLGVLDHLGLADDGRVDFPAVNARQRRTLLARLLRRTVGRNPRSSPTPAPPVRLDPAFARSLHGYFLPQVEKLESLLGRDLTAWKAPVARG